MCTVRRYVCVSQQLPVQDVLQSAKLGEQAAPAAEAEPAKVAEEEGEVDASGLSEVDVDLIMKQANVSKAVAVKTLKQTGDVVKAIMELSGVKA